MGKERDKQTKTAPPREADSTRQARLMSQLGLKEEGSAKMRRRNAGKQAKVAKGGTR